MNKTMSFIKSRIMTKLLATGIVFIILGFYVLISEKAKGIFEYSGGNNIIFSIIFFVIGIILILISLSGRR